MRRPPDIEDRLHAVWDALEEGEAEVALLEARRLARMSPHDPAVILARTAAAYEAGAFGESYEAASHGRQTEVDDDRTWGWYAGASALQLWMFEEAIEELEVLLDGGPDEPETWHLLAIAREMTGADAEAGRCYAKAAELDAEAFPLPVRISDKELDAAVRSAMDALPPSFRRKLEEVPLIVQNLPDPLIAEAEEPGGDRLPPDVLGLFVGQSDLERSVFDHGDVPGVIYLFRRNLERVCTDLESLVSEIRTTLWHELAHLLGFSEEEMTDLGLE